MFSQLNSAWVDMVTELQAENYQPKVQLVAAQADVRTLAKAIIDYRMAQNPHDLDFPEMQPVTKALARPGVIEVLATEGRYWMDAAEVKEG